MGMGSGKTFTESRSRGQKSTESRTRTRNTVNDLTENNWLGNLFIFLRCNI
jgi:hypothetical protein